MAAQPVEHVSMDPLEYTLAELGATHTADREQKLAARMRILQYMFQEQAGSTDAERKAFNARVQQAESGDTEPPLGKLFIRYQDESPIKELDSYYDQITDSQERVEFGQVLRVAAYIIHTSQQQ